MITPEQAYTIMFGGVYTDCHADKCTETDKYYVFSPVPKSLPASTRMLTGTIFPVVVKKTGEVKKVNIRNVGEVKRIIMFTSKKSK